MLKLLYFGVCTGGFCCIYIDKQVIEKAKVGLYAEKSIASVPADLKKKFFTQVGPSYQISEKSHN